jgi:hypothetical protein
MPTPVENLIGFSTITNGASTPPINLYRRNVNA